MSGSRKIPVNLITGPLGAGKTTTLLHLLKHKPAGERWAVLVNEFGQVGIDQGLIPQEDGLFVEAVPGGCICCSAGLPMRIALATLIRKAKPQRLLIEPTGLGHPLQILATLQEEGFREVLEPRATVCVVDVRLAADPERYAEPVLQDQLRLADVVIANKCDLADETQRQQFETCLAPLAMDKAHIGYTAQGDIPPAWLDAPRAPFRLALHADAHAGQHSEVLPATTLAPGIQRQHARGFGVEVLSYTLTRAHRLHDARTLPWLGRLPGALRVKAVLQLESGWVAFNRVGEECSLTVLPGEPVESCIEVIAGSALPEWDQALLDLLA